MAWLARHAQPMPLVELAEAARARRLLERAVAVTLDDGYPGQPDRGAAILTWHAGPPPSSCRPARSRRARSPGGTRSSACSRPGAAAAEAPAAITVGAEPPPLRTVEERAAAHGAIDHRLVRLGAAARPSRLDALAARAGLVLRPADDARPMTVAELRRLASLRGAAIGARGPSHLALPGLDPAAAARSSKAVASASRRGSLPR